MTYFIKSARRRCNHPHTRKKNLQHRPPPAYFSSLIVYTCGYPHTKRRLTRIAKDKVAEQGKNVEL